MNFAVPPAPTFENNSPAHRLPAIWQCAYNALLKVYGADHAKEFARWTIEDVLGEEWVEYVLPPNFPPPPEA